MAGDEKNTRRRVALRLSVGGKAGSGFLSRAFVLCRLRICASLCGARFFFSFSRGLLGPKHVEVHEMRAEFVVDGFGEELPGVCRIGSGVGCSLPQNCLSRRKQLTEQSRFSSTARHQEALPKVRGISSRIEQAGFRAHEGSMTVCSHPL